MHCRKRLGGKHNLKYILCDGHSFAAGDGCSVKLLPEGADAIAGSARTTVTIDGAYRARIEAKLAARPDPRAAAVCRIRKGLTGKTPLQMWRHPPYIRLPGRPEEIVWHLQCWYIRGVPCGEMHCDSALTSSRALTAMGRSMFAALRSLA